MSLDCPRRGDVNPLAESAFRAKCHCGGARGLDANARSETLRIAE